MPRTVPADLKARIPVLRSYGYSIRQICGLLGIKTTLVYKTLKLHSRFGVVSNRAIRRQQILIRRKNISTSAARRSEELKRALYMNRIAVEAPDSNMLLFVDQASKDNHTSTHQSESASSQVKEYLIHGVRHTVLSALSLDGIVVYDIVQGAVSGRRFLSFLNEHVMPFTNPYPGPRSVLVMDNCRIHRAEEIRAVVEDMHLCKLVFLPPHSPGYNPIEQAFSTINGYMQHEMHDFSLMSIVRACQKVTPDDTASCFKASGYIA